MLEYANEVIGEQMNNIIDIFKKGKKDVQNIVLAFGVYLVDR